MQFLQSVKKEDSKLSFFGKATRIWIATVLCMAIAAMNFSLIFFQPDHNDKDDIVIVLDPGHGGVDIGAYNSALGLYESEINLKIAIACRDILMHYDGVRVYMTHTGVRTRQGDASLRNRINVAQEVGADIFISLHINSADSKTAHGAEIYVPHTTYKAEYNQKCTELANKILDNFKKLGLGSRGVKERKSGGARTYTYDNGTSEVGDYYYVVGEPIRRLGIPGILVEHAFIEGDSDFLDSDEELELLGKADAEAIAEYYGLTLKDEYKHVSSQETSSHTADAGSNISSDDNGGFTSEEDMDEEVAAVESMINALPDNPTADDYEQINKVRAAFDALGDNKQSLVSAELYQKLCNVITACENLRLSVRIAVKQGSEMAIDRVNNKLLNVETAKQNSGKITVFSIMLELELYISPSAPEKYQDETNLDYRIVNPDGDLLEYSDTVPNGSVISIVCDNEVLDSLTLVILS
ncbi:MAG: N-acetylmuramoyl-L-alanine amidase [Firmicutes bacterium]|nr:N-acetylmuramoyl-L-alanine amidase [Bacillota bacterium]